MTGEDWLFIPGTLCDARVFAPLLEQLEGRRTGTVRIVDTLDHDDLAVLAQRVTQGLGPRLRVVGFSLGCQVAFEIMRQDPTRCAGLALISSTARPDLPDLAPDRRALVDQFRRDGADVIVEQHLWPRYVAAPMQPGHRAKALIGAMARDCTDTHFAAQTALAMSRPDSRPDLSRFRRPVLMINGQEDRLTPVALGAEIAKTACRGTHRIIEGAGHFVLLENPEAVAQAISIWIKREKI